MPGWQHHAARAFARTSRIKNSVPGKYGGALMASASRPPPLPQRCAQEWRQLHNMSQTVSGLRLAMLGNHTARWLSCWRTTAETSHTDREEEVNKGLEETDSGQMVADTHIQIHAKSENCGKMLDKFKTYIYIYIVFYNHRDPICELCKPD